MAAFFKISFSSRSLAFSRRSVPRSCSAVTSSCLGTPLRSSSSKSRRPLAQLVYPNAQFPRHLGLGLISNGSQPHRFKLELPAMVPAFLAFHDTALLRPLCLSGTVHETWVTSLAARIAPDRTALDFV